MRSRTRTFPRNRCRALKRRGDGKQRTEKSYVLCHFFLFFSVVFSFLKEFFFVFGQFGLFYCKCKSDVDVK